MPAERTRYSRRSQADGAGLVWTLPVEPTGASGIAFAPNLTESTFADLPPLVDAPDVASTGSFIFTAEDPSTGSTRRAVHGRKKSDNHIPRPPNAFILFRSSFIKSQRVSTEVETSHSTLSKIIGLTWKNLSDEERQSWRLKAMDAVAEHKRNFPSYAFRPKHRSKKDADAPNPKTKRKVREVYQDPVRCEKIAELLAEGKTGTDLECAIQEFDKHHVPEIVTRFETPITARAYRRSSSVPVPSSDDSRSFLSSAAACSPSGSRRRRSSSVGAETRAAQEQAKHRQRAASTFRSEAGDSTCSDGFITPPSFSKQEPLDTLDFSSFSFSNVSSPAPSLGFDPLLIPMSPLELPPYDNQPSSPAICTPVEPMDVSAFIASHWLQYGDCANPFGECPPAEYPAPPFPFAYPMPTYVDPTSTFCQPNFKNTSYEPQQAYQAQLAQLEADLASFTAQYSL
ncbi:hypothetical protein FB45DRAFT_1017781 [Roridomyces roridus]|uniref:HMG box domain-containing protein n=1 Tax=Roridomyces roridus TaxID=1738132 RepID=A0AAD7CJE8_9AGAR|nr:hypothetical protein FB45DRAFT_1017781 [Roridomyces roridus]